jgi:uncharacterized protein (UPF0303 family)
MKSYDELKAEMETIQQQRQALYIQTFDNALVLM